MNEEMYEIYRMNQDIEDHNRIMRQMNNWQNQCEQGDIDSDEMWEKIHNQIRENDRRES